MLGVVIMLTASTMAVNHWHVIPANLWDGFAYLLHGVGAVPIVWNLEPFWLLLIGAVE